MVLETEIARNLKSKFEIYVRVYHQNFFVATSIILTETIVKWNKSIKIGKY